MEAKLRPSQTALCPAVQPQPRLLSRAGALWDLKDFPRTILPLLRSSSSPSSAIDLNTTSSEKFSLASPSQVAPDSSCCLCQHPLPSFHALRASWGNFICIQCFLLLLYSELQEGSTAPSSSSLTPSQPCTVPPSLPPSPLLTSLPPSLLPSFTPFLPPSLLYSLFPFPSLPPYLTPSIPHSLHLLSLHPAP